MDKYQNIIIKVKSLPRIKVEKNIFSIGGRGHYENPISNILKFFIDPNEEHGFGSLFLRSLFEGAKKEQPFLEHVSPPNREQTTDSGNRIDLIIEGDDWVMVIENKIWHTVDNPFKDYEDYINNNYKEKEHIFILLSMRKENVHGWIAVTYKDFIDCLKRNVGSYLISANNNKWYVILREFILNLENEYGGHGMNEERIKFIKENYAEIQEINDIFREYIEYIKTRGKTLIDSVTNQEVAITGENNWEEGIAIRFYSNLWKKNTNITVLLRKDGSLRIQIYVYEVRDDEVDNLKKYIDKYKEYWSEQKTIRAFRYFDGVDHEIIFSEFSDVVKKLNAYYAS